MNRAQSEVTGEILLVAIVILSVSAFGVAYLDTVGMDQPTRAELMEVSDNDSIEIANAGGATLTNDSVEIVLRNETTSLTLHLTDGDVLNRTSDDRLAAGEIWRWDDWGAATLTGREIEMMVVTGDRILLETTKRRPI